jgi:hypothetical protein
LHPTTPSATTVHRKDIFFVTSVLIGQLLLHDFDLGIDFELGTTAAVLDAAPSPVLLGCADNFDQLFSQRLDDLVAAWGNCRGSST